MSDFSMYELEDIVWDDFGQTDDHIVPHHSDTHPNDQSFQSENRKRPRHDVNRVSNHKFVGQQKEERDSTTQNKKRKTMLKKDPWSHIAADGVFSPSCDNSRMPGQHFESGNIDSIGDSELCADDPILGDISQSQNDLSFLDNDQNDKESNDLLYYGWPDIENFEDVDRMFRSCDSSFGLGGAGNEDKLGWLSSSDAIEGSEDALMSELKFSCPESNALKSRSQEASNVSNESSSINDSNTRSALASCNASSRPLVIDEPTMLSHTSFAIGSNQSSESKDNFMPNDQFSMHKKQQKHKSRREEKVQDKNIHLSPKDTSHQLFTSVGIRPQKQSVGLDSFSYLQTNTPYMHLDYSLPSDQTTVGPKLSGVKSENNSYAANAIKIGEDREKVFRSSITSNPKHMGLVVQAPICDPVSARKEVHQYSKGLKNQSDIEEVDLGILSNVQESSSRNSKLDEISLEASSFHQLQQVMEQLDLRTKLCIRDSLYRLAKSAEQRHNYANLNGGSIDDRDTSGTFIAEGTNKCTGFMDMETDTNPIDRTVAHLLFHRPPESSAPSLKSHAMICGPIANHPLKAEKIVGREES